MNRHITFALGSIWKWEQNKNRNVLFNYIRSLDIDGVEITFGGIQELKDFNLSKENEIWLKTLRCNSLHAPFRMISKAKDEDEIIAQLKKMQDIYKRINAKNVIIHPGEIPKPEILKKFKMRYSTENMEKKRKISHRDLENIFKLYPKMGLCIDVSHAYTYDKHEVTRLVKKFGNKITQVHLSATYRKKRHRSMQIATKEFLASIEPIKKLKIPLVIEESIKEKDKNYLVEEVKFIRDLYLKK